MSEDAEEGDIVLGLFKAVYLGTVPLIEDDDGALITDKQLYRCFRQCESLNQIPRKIIASGLHRNQTRFWFISNDPDVRITICHMFSVKERSLILPDVISKACHIHENQHESLLASNLPMSSDIPQHTTIDSGSSEKKSPMKLLKRKSIGFLSRHKRSSTSRKTSLDSQVQHNNSADSESKASSAPMSSSSVITNVDEGDDFRSMGTFLAKLIGTHSVREKTGQTPVNETLEKYGLNKIDANGKAQRSRRHLAGDGILLVISNEAIRIVDRLSNHVLESLFIRNITYTLAGYLNRLEDFFAIIHHDVRLDVSKCYLFEVNHGVAEQLCKVVSRAFQAFKQEVETAKTFVSENKQAALCTELPDRLQELKLHREDIVALRVIGSGVYGKVYLADQKLGDDQTIQRAVKLLRGKSTSREQHLVSVIGVNVEQLPWLCVLEFMQYGDLGGVLEAISSKNISLFETELLHLSLQIVKGMKFIASQRFVHMDLAARNCLLHTNNAVKIGDFGLTRPFDEGNDYWLMRETLKLAVKWIPPDALKTKRFGEPSDVWAFGVCLWEIYSMGANPFHDVPVPEVPTRVRKGLRLEKPSSCPDGIYAIMMKCWDADPRKRFTFSQLEVELSQGLAVAKRQYPPARDVGELVNQKLSKDIRRMSVAVRKQSVSRQQLTGTRKQISVQDSLSMSQSSNFINSADDSANGNEQRLLSADENTVFATSNLQPSTDKIETVNQNGKNGSSSESDVAQINVVPVSGNAISSTSERSAQIYQNKAENENELDDDTIGEAPPEVIPNATRMRLTSFSRAGFLKSREATSSRDETNGVEREQIQSDASHITLSKAEEDFRKPKCGLNSGAVATMEGILVPLDHPVDDDEVIPDDFEVPLYDDDDDDDDDDGDGDGDGDQGGDNKNQYNSEASKGSVINEAQTTTQTLSPQLVLDEHAKDNPQPPEALNPATIASKICADSQAFDEVISHQSSTVKENDNENNLMEQNSHDKERQRLERYRRLGLIVEDNQQQQEAERSRIYQALNPKVLFKEQTSESRQIAVKNRDCSGLAEGVGADEGDGIASGESLSRIEATTTPGIFVQEMEDAIAFADDDDEDVDDDDDDAENDDVDISTLPEFGELEKYFQAQRQKRAEEQERRRLELQAEHDRIKREEAAAREYLLTKIERKKADEEAKRQQSLQETMQESMTRLKELQFSFSFDDSSA